MNLASDDIRELLLKDPKHFEICTDKNAEGVCRIWFTRQGDPGYGMTLAGAAKLADEIRKTSTKTSHHDLADQIDSCVEKGKRYAEDTG